MNIKVMLLSACALLAFAGNSVLCRLAFANNSIDPAAFTAIRLISGAMMLIVLLLFKNGFKSELNKPSKLLGKAWLAPLMLFAYAGLFSFAYVSLDTGVGALILFGSVQITLWCLALLKGEKFSLVEFLGLLLASSGLVYLVLPELSKPSFSGFIMMSLSGVAWAIYTIKGQGSSQALIDTSSNFIKATPLALLLLVAFHQSIMVTSWGIIMAILSGVLTSAIGYAIWYAVLPHLKTSQAGVMQLLVPIIAAIGGVLFGGETLSARLILSASLTLGGILMILWAKKRRKTI